MGALELPTGGTVYLDNLKTPDAIHAATALLNGCAFFVTNDNAFRRLSNVSIAVLNEIDR